MLGSQLVARPERGGGGHGIEIFELDETGGGFVVIATDENVSQTAGALDNFVGAGAVADHVAEIGNLIERRSRGEAGFKSFEIGVNVAEYQYAQGTPDKVGIIA